MAAALTLGAVLAGCGGDGGSGPVATTISVAPATHSLRVGETVDLVGTPVDANQRVVGLPGQMTWSSSATAIATVNNAGRVTGVSPGSADITARIGQVSGTARITVTQLPVARVDVAPTSVSFGRTQTRQLTASAFAADNSALTGRSFTWTTSSTAVVTLSGTTGSTVTVTAVAPGNATVTATSEDVKRDVPVIVEPDPVITFTPTTANFGSTVGGANPAAQVVTVSNTGGGTLTGLAAGTITYGGGPSGWLTAAFESGTAAPAPLTLRATTGSLALGTYTASVPVTSTVPGVAAKALSVSFTVGSALVLGASATSASFTAPPVSGNPGSQAINIFSVNGTVIPGLTVGAIEYASGSNWLTATLSGSATPATLTLQPNVGSLAPGTYTANVPVSAPTATNSPVKVAVTLVVPPPSIVLSPSTQRSFVATQGVGTTSGQAITISNGGRGTLTNLQVSISYGAGATNWLTPSLSSNTATATLTLTPTANSIARGTYTATVNVSAPGASNSPQSVSVSYQLVYTFDRHISGIVSSSTCSSSSCHASQAPVMSSSSGDVYQRLLNGYVVAGAPGSSKIYQRVSSTSSPMPPSGVIPAVRDAIGFWITDGARRNTP